MIARLVALALSATLLGCAADPPPADGRFEAPLALAAVDSRSGGGPVGPGVQLAPRAYVDDEELVDELRLGRSEPDEPGRWWLAASPVDDLVVCGDYDGIELWRVDPTTGARVRLDARRVGPRDRGSGRRVDQAAWHPTGRYVVTLAGEGILQAWRPTGVQLVPCPRAQEGSPVGLAFLPDGALLVLSAVGALERWTLDVADGRLRRERTLVSSGAPTGQASGLVVVSADGRRAFVSRGSYGEVWALGDESRALGQVRFGGHVWMRAAAFSPDGRLLVVGGGNQEWSIATLHEVTDKGLAPRGTLLDDHLRGNTDLAVVAAAFRGDEVLLATTRSLERWRTAPPSLIGAVRGRSQHAVAFSADGCRALDDDLGPWRFEEGTPGIQRVGVPPTEDEGDVLARSPDGQRSVRRAAWGAPAELWQDDATPPAAVAELGPLDGAAFAPDGRWLLTTGDGEVTAWRLGPTPEATDSLAVEGEWLAHPCLAADGRFTVLGEALTLGRLDAEGRLSLLERWAPCEDAALSPSGDALLATAGPRGLPGARLWRLVGAEGGRVARVPVARLSGLARAVSFSPDGALALTRGDLQADLWRLDPTGGLPRHERTLADLHGPVELRGGAVVMARMHAPLAVQLSGDQAIDVAGQPLRWDRPASATQDLPALAVRVEREEGALVVTVTNAGPGPAHELLGRVRFEHERAPLGEERSLAFGSLAAGQVLTRRLALPTGDRLWLRDVAWTERFGRAPPPTPLDPAPVRAPSSVRREVLREAARLALDLAGDEAWDWTWLGPALTVALARDGDLPAALQLGVGRRADLAALAAGDTSQLLQRWPLDEEKAVRAALDRGDLGAAAEAATRTQSQPVGDELRLEVSAALARAGRVDEALLLGPGYGRHSSAVTALLEAAAARVEAGDLAGAQALARRVETTTDVDPLEPATWFVDVDFSQSMSVDWKVTGRLDELVRAAARLHVLLGRSHGARCLAAFEGRSATLLRAIASGQTAAGDPDGAREWAERLRDPAARAAALLGIGEGLLPPLRPGARGW